MINQKDDKYYLEKIVQDLTFITAHMNGVSIENLTGNEVLLDSMLFRMIQIQENSKKLTDTFKLTHKDIPWTDIAGLRNRIVHDYGNVDLNVVYDTLTKDIPLLLEDLQK